MNEGVQRENGMHKTDHYKHAQMQWMEGDPSSNHYMKESMKIMALIAERDSAFQEMNIAFAEKKAALAERDMAFLQRDAAISDRNSAVTERDKALAALHHHQQQNHPLNPQQNQYFHPELYNNNNNDLFDNGMNKSKRRKRNPKEPKKKQKMGQNSTRVKNEEWRDQQHTGLNQVSFDETNMPVPVCSCTGNYHQCYKWGEGGWQSSCCTLTMSVHPLPVMANKKHARMSGRKMSGSVFKRLLSRLAAEGCDLSLPVDLKDHWSRHGTNRYITIK